jgi:hypothetical protein
MKYALHMLVLASALTFAGQASAQIVNGNNGANGSPSAPIGTKAGGSDAAQQASGEADATAGAIQNDRDDKAMQNNSTRHTARNARRNSDANSSSANDQ